VANASDILLRLNAALDGLSSALESGDAGEVLAAEVPLATAVESLTRLDLSGTGPAPELALALLNTRLAVDRCNALGQTGSDLLAIISGQTSYGRGGRSVAPQRSTTLEARS
jgi:hypothetical protein